MYLGLGNVVVDRYVVANGATLGVGGCDVVTHHHHMATSSTNTHTRELVTGYWLLVVGYCWLFLPLSLLL